MALNHHQDDTQGRVPPRPFSLMFGEACKTIIAFLVAAESDVELSREKADFHTSGSAY